MKKFLLALVLLLSLVTPGWATVYNIGPGQTYETFTALVAAHNLTSDDIVDGGGNTFLETWTTAYGGTSGHPVILRNAIIDGENTRANLLTIDNCSYITVSGITFLNNTGANKKQLDMRWDTNGITVTGCIFSQNTYTSGEQAAIGWYPGGGGITGITITGNTISGAMKGIIGWYNAGEKGSTSVTISNNTIHDLTSGANALQGIYLYSDNTSYTYHDVTISGNTIMDVSGYAILTALGTTARDAGSYPYNITVTGNTITRSGYSAYFAQILKATGTSTVSRNKISQACYGCSEGCNALQLSGVNNTVVEYNDVSYTDTGGEGDGSGIILDFAFASDTYLSNSNIVRYNHSHHNAKTASSAGLNIFRGSNTQVYYNIFDHNGNGIAQGHSTSTNNEYYNNTVVYNTNGYMTVDSNPASILKNNIFAFNTDYGLTNGAGCTRPTEDYNIVYGSTTNFRDDVTPGWIAAAHSKVLNPLLTGAFRVNMGSPALNAGVDVSLTQDIIGLKVSRLIVPTIGAYEYPNVMAIMAPVVLDN